MTTIKIRPAKPLDTSNLVRLLTAAHDEAGAYPPVDQALGLNWITQTLMNGYVIVADVSGRLVGTLALTNFQFPWSPKYYMYLEWLYVQKKFRKGGAFEALIKGCHAYADELDAPILAGVSSADRDVFLKDKVFQHQGYKYIGGDFIRPARSERSGQQDEEIQADVHAAIVG
jgi:hypothetical protein